MSIDNFHNVTLNTYFSLNAQVTIRFRTNVHVMKEKHEERIGDWQDPLREYNLTPALRDQADLDELIAFWRARYGQRYTFKLVDPIDNSVTNHQFGIGNGSQKIFQLVKRYTTGISGDTHVYYRPIVLPDANGLRIYVGGVEQTGGFTVDYLTGVVTFVTAPGNVPLTWTGTFQVPVNFAVNQLFPYIEMYERFETPITLIEARMPVHANVLTEAEPEDFVEVRFPDDFAERSRIGPEFNVIRVTSDSGSLQHVPQFAEPKMYFSITKSAKSFAELNTILNFFLCRKGRLVGFRMKDVLDYQAINQSIGTGDASTTIFQLKKTYISGGFSQTRTITKPVAGSFTIYGNGLPFAKQPVVDTNTGKVEFTLGNITLTFIATSKRILRSSGSWIADGINVGSTIIISGSVHNNGTFTVVAVYSSLEIEVSQNVVNETDIVCKVSNPPAHGTAITWTGEFDVAVRFDTDELTLTILGYGNDGLGVYDVESMTLTEIMIDLPTAVYNQLQTPVAILSGCSVPCFIFETAVTHYVEFDGAAYLKTSPLEILTKNFKGGSSITVGFLVSHVYGGTIFDHQQFDGAAAFRVSFFQGSLRCKFAAGGHRYTSVALGPGPFGPIGFCHSGVVESGEVTFSDNGNGVFEDLHAYVITFDIVGQSAYCSGSAHGDQPLLGATMYSHSICSKAGILHMLPEIININPVRSYVGSTVQHIGGGHFNNGQLGGIGIFPSSGLISDGFGGRLYEFFISVVKDELSKMELVEIGHKSVLQYWKSKYGSGFRGRSGFLLLGDSGYWRAGPHITNIAGSDVIVEWPAGLGDIQSGGTGGFSWVDTVPFLGVRLKTIPATAVPGLHDVMYLATGRRLVR